jgi:hypothetical protein
VAWRAPGSGRIAPRASLHGSRRAPTPRRHNVPGEDMWLGEWSEEEVQLFVKVRRPNNKDAAACCC